MASVCFYYISNNYINFLKSFEKSHRGFTCVPNVEYKSNTKFFYGTVLEINGIDYYVPVSSKIKDKQDDIIISDKKGNRMSSLRFNFMIPVPKETLSRLEIKNNFSDKEAIRIKKELAFCRRNKDSINVQAKKTYKRVIGKVSEDFIKNSCDFKLLEDAYIEYCLTNGLKLSEALEERHTEK